MKSEQKVKAGITYLRELARDPVMKAAILKIRSKKLVMSRGWADRLTCGCVLSEIDLHYPVLGRKSQLGDYDRVIDILGISAKRAQNMGFQTGVMEEYEELNTIWRRELPLLQKELRNEKG